MIVSYFLRETDVKYMREKRIIWERKESSAGWYFEYVTEG